MSFTMQPTLTDDLDRFYADVEAFQDPYPLFDRLLREAPVFRYQQQITTLARHRDIKMVYRDVERFPTTPTRSTPLDGRLDGLSEHDRDLLADIHAFEANTISRRNGPGHTRLRRVAHRYFTPRFVNGMQEAIQRLLDDLLAPLAGHEVVDLMGVAYSLPLLVITDMFGVQREDAPLMKRWGDEINEPGEYNPLPREVLRRSHRAHTDQSDHVRELVGRHRAAGSHTPLVAGLLEAVEQERINEAELITFVVHTLFAGHETTQHMIGNGVRALMLHREQWDELCADPEGLAAGAVEEALRWDPPVPVNAKSVAAGVELDGVPLPEGSTLQLFLGAANRDPEVFEDPTTFNVHRPDNDHLSLAFGPHFCLGAGLARQEGVIWCRTLAQRFPDLELAVDASDLRYHRGIRGLDALPVRLGRDRG